MPQHLSRFKRALVKTIPTVGVALLLHPCLVEQSWGNEAKKNMTELSFPPEDRALETLEANIVAFTPLPGKLALLANAKPYVVLTPFPLVKMDPKLPLARFGGAKKLSLPFAGTRLWNAIAALGDTFLLFDGELLNTARVSQSMAVMSEHSVVYDLLKPAADQGGEAPAFEISDLRARFRKRIAETAGLKLASMTPFPQAWGKPSGDEGDAYLLSTRLKGFPLLTMHCTSENQSQCRITRACKLSGFPAGEGSKLSGIATSAKRKLILMADPDQHRILAFHWSSCRSSKLAYTLSLPPKLKTLSGLQVDDEDRLWLSTEQADDYHNASLFYWPASEW